MDEDNISYHDKEICICAAHKTVSGEIFRGNRHCNCLATIAWAGRTPSKKADDSGFITSRNRFVTRREGYLLQRAAGIESADPGGYRGEELYSEDLY